MIHAHASQYVRGRARSSAAYWGEKTSQTQPQTNIDSWHIHGGNVIFTSWAFRQTPECDLSLSTFSPAWEVAAGVAGAVDAGCRCR
jgi:hypothetical protein